MYAVILILSAKKQEIVPIKWVHNFNKEIYQKNKNKSYFCFLHNDFSRPKILDAKTYNKPNLRNTTGYLAKVLVKKLFGKSLQM